MLAGTRTVSWRGLGPPSVPCAHPAPGETLRLTSIRRSKIGLPINRTVRRQPPTLTIPSTTVGGSFRFGLLRRFPTPLQFPRRQSGDGSGSTSTTRSPHFSKSFNRSTAIIAHRAGCNYADSPSFRITSRVQRHDRELLSPRMAHSSQSCHPKKQSKPVPCHRVRDGARRARSGSNPCICRPLIRPNWRAWHE